MISAVNLWTVSIAILCSVSLSCLNVDAAENLAALRERDHSFASPRRFKLSLDAGDFSGHPDLKVEKRSPAEIQVFSTGGEASDFDTNNSQFVQQMTDFILHLIRSHIISQNKRQIELPDIHKSSCKGIGYLCVTLALNATEGWFRDLSSITRVGDVKVFRNEDNIIMDFGIGLRTIQLGYNKYRLKVGPLKLSGKIDGEMGPSVVRVKFSMDVGQQTCSISLLETEVSFLGEPKLRLTGMGKLNPLFSKIVTWFAGRARKDAAATAEDILRNTVQDVFERLRCDEEVNNVQAL
ncbi:uncharacterized protein LOC126143997 [Schistocerca cancellata]|uniref:uncharacterized protein LOC126143997 n=1 Tax=Schistocerca cancellata TaxID=274614 RepID=UPI002117B6C5|nr:uncharacterized protein LOC126143997 [Schistocerca cancellata]